MIDACLITHFHLDHCGALPYFSEAVGYSGPIIATPPTKAIIPLMLEDFRKVAVAKKDEVAGNWPEVELSKVQQVMLKRASELLRRIDIDVTLFPLKIVNGLGDLVMGRALEGTMYLSLLPFNMGTKQVASTLIEEWVHTKTGAHDFDRAMQSWLFDKILSLAEEITGEPV